MMVDKEYKSPYAEPSRPDAGLQMPLQKHGRSAKEKTLQDHLIEMGCCVKNEDQYWEDEARRTDTRGAFQYGQELSADFTPEHASGHRLELFFWVEMIKVLALLIRKAGDPHGNVKPGDLPLAFRFAMRRPLMPEAKFQACLKALKLKLDLGQGDMRLEQTLPIGKLRKLLYGIDVNHNSKHHVSSTLADLIPQSAPMDTAMDQVGQLEQPENQISIDADSARGQLQAYQALLDVYFLIEGGSVKVEDGSQRYRAALNRPDMSDAALSGVLESFGMPADHISSEVRAGCVCASKRFPLKDLSDYLACNHNEADSAYDGVRQAVLANIPDRKVLAELIFLISFCRTTSDDFPTEETTSLIQESLNDFPTTRKGIGDLLLDFDLDVEQAALLIWAAAKYNNESSNEKRRQTTDQDVGDTSNSRSRTVTTINHGFCSRSTTTIHMAEGESSGEALLPETFEYTISAHESLLENEPAGDGVTFQQYCENVNHKQPSTLTTTLEPAESSEVLRIHNPQLMIKTNWDGTVLADGKERSPEDGLTDDLFGIVMRSKTAREIAHQLGFPISFCSENYRSKSISRMRAKEQDDARASKLLPRSKRKASATLTPDRLPKIARCDNSDIFARDGEDSKAFALSHFSPNDIGEVCVTCLQVQCDCNAPRDRQCVHCKQTTCKCTQTTSSNVPRDSETDSNLNSARSPKLKLLLRPASDTIKPSATDYLSRLIGGTDILTKLKEYEKAPISDIVIERVGNMLNHIQQGLLAGTITFQSGDQEVVDLMQRLIEGHPEHSKDEGQSEHSSSAGTNSLLRYLSGTKEKPSLYVLRAMSEEVVSDRLLRRVEKIRKLIDKGIMAGTYDPTLPSEDTADLAARDIVHQLISKCTLWHSQAEKGEQFNPVLCYLMRDMNDNELLRTLEEFYALPHSVARCEWFRKLGACISIGVSGKHISKFGVGKGDQALKYAFLAFYDFQIKARLEHAHSPWERFLGDAPIKRLSTLLEENRGLITKSPETLEENQGLVKESSEILEKNRGLIKEPPEIPDTQSAANFRTDAYNGQIYLLSNPHLAYLSAVMNGDDVLASLRNLDHSNFSTATIDTIAKITNHIQVGVSTGSIDRNDLGDEDMEAHRILESLTFMWATLQSYQWVDRVMVISPPKTSVLPLRPSRSSEPAPRPSSRNLEKDFLPLRPSSSSVLPLRPSRRSLESNLIASVTEHSRSPPRDRAQSIVSENGRANLDYEDEFDARSTLDTTALKEEAKLQEFRPSRAGNILTPPSSSHTERMYLSGYGGSEDGSEAECPPPRKQFPNPFLNDPAVNPFLNDPAVNPRNQSDIAALTPPTSPKAVNRESPEIQEVPPSPRPPKRKSPETQDVPSSPRPPKYKSPETQDVPPSPRPKFRDVPPSPRPARHDSLQAEIGPCSPRPGRLDSPKVKNPHVQSSSHEDPTAKRMAPIALKRAGKEWSNMSSGKAIEFAKKKALQQRKTLFVYLEELRAHRSQIKDQYSKANLHYDLYRFFQNSNSSSGSSSSNAALNKVFDRYRDNAAAEPDRIGVEGTMQYLGELGVKLDEAAVLAVLTELGAPTMGELTREGFINGWTNHRAETITKQQAQISSFRRSLTQTPDFFKKVYRNTFLIARLPGQKVLPLETAIEYWRLLLTSPSLAWTSERTPWLEWWIEYLETKWKKSVSKDMWDQTGSFALKALEDESMAWWSEDGAWPGVIDEFVGFVRGRRGDEGGKGEVGEGDGGEMDVG